MKNFRQHLQSKANVSEDAIDKLIPQLQTKTVAKGQIILSPGEVCQHSFFVESGLLRSFTIDSLGREHILQFAPETWIISDRSSVFFHEPSELFIDAVEDTNFILLDAQFICNASEISQDFAIYNELALQNHIRHLQKRINLLLSASAEQRYLNFIELYSDLTLRVPQWMIASYLGITPESLSRVRKNLAHQNFKG